MGHGVVGWTEVAKAVAWRGASDHSSSWEAPVCRRISELPRIVAEEAAATRITIKIDAFLKFKYILKFKSNY